MDWTMKKKYTEERGKLIADMQTLLKTANDETRDLSAEENGKFDEMHKRAEEIKSQIDRYEQFEKLAISGNNQRQQQQQQPGREDIDTTDKREKREAEERRAAFNQYLRHGILPNADEQRAVTISDAGVVGDRTVYNQLVTSMKTFAGVRQAGATILPTTDGNDLAVPTANDTSNTGQIVGEASSDDTEANPTVSNITLGAYKFDSKWIKVSIEMLQDAAYPLENYILSIAGERIGRAFNSYATTGTGSGQPKGFITAATAGATAASKTAIVYDELVDLVHSVDAGYRNSPNFRLMMHDTTLAAIRKLKDGANHYIFAAGAAGIPSLIMDYQYVVNNDMAQLTSGVSSKVVAAGDFSRYFVRDVTAVTIIRATELFAGSGLVGFRIFSRHDGNLTDTNAIKYLKLAAT